MLENGGDGLLLMDGKQPVMRVAALEVLLYTRGISNLIREGKSFQIPSAIQTGKKEGIQPLLADRGLTVGV